MQLAGSGAALLHQNQSWLLESLSAIGQPISGIHEGSVSVGEIHILDMVLF